MSTTLSRTEFEAWLESHAPDAVVGKCDDSQECPIGTFLGWKGGSAVEVRIEGVVVDGQRERLPEWAFRFVSRVDDWHADDCESQVRVGCGCDCARRITAAEALRILREITDADV
jgi:hypothetical protein